MNQTQSPDEKQKRVWSPRALVWFAVLFSVFPAAIMFAINYGSYGQPRKRFIGLAIVVIVLSVFWVLDYVDPGGTKLRVIGLTVLTAWILYAKQIHLFREWRSQGGGVASVRSGLGICLGFVAVCVGVAIALSYLEPDYLASDLIEKGDFRRAEQVLNESLLAYPRDLDVRYNLAVVYSETERKDAAIRELRTILARKPRDQQTRAFLLELTNEATRTKSTEQTSGDSSTRADAGLEPPQK